MNPGLNQLLENDDALVVPPINTLVYVEGEVVRPGSFLHTPNLKYNDYVGMAGGPSALCLSESRICAARRSPHLGAQQPGHRTGRHRHGAQVNFGVVAGLRAHSQCGWRAGCGFFGIVSAVDPLKHALSRQRSSGRVVQWSGEWSSGPVVKWSSGRRNSGQVVKWSSERRPFTWSLGH